MTARPDEKILLVDDEKNVLDALRRTHRAFRFHTATSGAAGLEVIAEHGPFAVVVSDYQMPGMDGGTFLGRVAQVAPETVRLMLTGNADLDAAVDAVNRGQVFHFLRKPCDPAQFAAGLGLALRQHRLLNAERLLLEQTLTGSVEVLAHVLAHVSPLAFGCADRVRGHVRAIVAALGLPDPWQYEVAALLSQIGCVAIPQEVLDRQVAGEPLDVDQERVLRAHPEIAHGLLRRIPRLEAVADAIAHQDHCFVPPPGQAQSVEGEAIPIGGRILAVALGMDRFLRTGSTWSAALQRLRSHAGVYDPALLDVLARVEVADTPSRVATVSVDELATGMILDQDVFNDVGARIAPQGAVLDDGTLMRLRNHHRLGVGPEMINVRVPLAAEPGPAAAVADRATTPRPTARVNRR